MSSPMICRHAKQGQKLDVAGLNEITVLIDRSETELTEVAMNSWSPGLDGPPHAHEAKEQNFLVTSGRGVVKIGDETFPVTAGGFYYIPASVIHQTINQSSTDRLEYFLFNAFLDADKEGHASFADHISKVKETRRQQAASQSAGIAARPAGAGPARGRYVALNPQGGIATTLIGRKETQRCESIRYLWPAGHMTAPAADSAKEQTFFVADGAGRFTVGDASVEVAAGNVVFVPRNAAFSVAAGPTGLHAVSFGTVV